MSSDYVLAIDNGTQSVRALLFDTDGNLVAKGKQEIEPYFSTQPGWAEQHPGVYWDALGKACAALWASSSVDRKQVRGLAVTAQRASVINLDERGEPLRPAIVWLDQRHADARERLPGKWGWIFRLLGAEPMVRRLRENCQANWIAQNQPEIWERTHKFLLVSGYLNYRLTGNYRDSTGSQVGYIPFDAKRMDWAVPGDWRWQGMPVRPEQLPELVPPGGLIGEVCAVAAEHTGIPRGLPVFAAAADKACEVLGSGGSAPHVACLSFGTTATINTTHRRPLEPMPLMPPYPAAIPDAWCSEIMIYRGFWMVSWFREQFGLQERERAAEQGGSAEALFEELVNSVPPGAMGLTLQPYWSPGVREPGPEAKGAIIGFGDVHTRAHVYRAILEGLAYGLRAGKEQLEKRSGVPVTELRVAGGGSQSNAAMQITADVFGMPAARPHTWEASGLGAAIDAAVGLGLHPDFETAVARMTRPGEVFRPRKEVSQLYDRLYGEVYARMYARLRPLYRSIAEITGYPAL